MAIEAREGEHTVSVWDRPYTVTLRQRKKFAWVAVGDYRGRRIEARDQTAGTALKRWQESAIYKGS